MVGVLWLLKEVDDVYVVDDDCLDFVCFCCGLCVVDCVGYVVWLLLVDGDYVCGVVGDCVVCWIVGVVGVLVLGMVMCL